MRRELPQFVQYLSLLVAMNTGDDEALRRLREGEGRCPDALPSWAGGGIGKTYLESSVELHSCSARGGNDSNGPNGHGPSPASPLRSASDTQPIDISGPPRIGWLMLGERVRSATFNHEAGAPRGGSSLALGVRS